MEPILRGTALEKQWNGVVGLGGVDIQIRKSEITCIIGPSGGGKSTLLRALCLIDAPDRGTVEIDGMAFTFPRTGKESVKGPWPHVTMVFQQLFLWPHITLRNNILLPLNSRPRLSKEWLDELIAALGLEPYLDRYPNQVSLGQRQRVAIARALALRPAYLLMDEVTSALDVEQIAAVATVIKKLAEEGAGVALTTHVLGLARKVADQVVFLENGEIKAHGDLGVIETPTNDRVRAFLSVFG